MKTIFLKVLSIFLLATTLFSSCLNEEFEKEILVQTREVDEIGIVNATLKGQIIDFGNGIDQYGHCWSTNQIPSINDSISIVNKEINGDYISQISNLLDETIYYYRSYAKKGSNVVYGDVSSFITFAYGIPIVELNIQEASYRNISGDINLKYLGGYEQIDEIGVLCSKTPDITDEDSVIKFIEIESTGNYYFNIENLDHNEQYYLKAFVKFKNGINYSSQIIVNTIDGTPILDLDIQNVLYEEISGNINLTNLGAYDQIEEVGVCWSKETNPNIEDSIFSYNSIDTIGYYSFNLNNLDDGEQYFIRAYAKYDNEITYSLEKDFLMLEYKMPEILINSITNITNNSFSVNLEIVNFGGYDLLENYGLCWGEMQDPTIDDNIIEFGLTSNIENTEVLLNGLDSLKTYYVKAFAINDKGISYSSEFSVRTGIIVSGGLIAYYPFDKDVNDYSGNENNATNHGAILTDDRFGNENSAYDFDGLNDYMQLTNTLNASKGLSFSFWVNSKGIQSGENNGVIISKYDAVSDYRCFAINTWNENYGGYALRGNFYSSQYTADYRDCAWSNIMSSSDIPSYWNFEKFEIVNPKELPLNRWVHCIINVTETEVQAWIDGVLTVKKVREYSTYFDSNYQSTYIGNTLSGGVGDNNHFYGSIDELRVYNRALTEDEIQYLYHEGGWDE